MPDSVPARVVVTGAQGLLGRHVSRALLAGGAGEVLGVGRSARLPGTYSHDLRWAGRDVPAPLPLALREVDADPRYDYRRLDLGDADAVARVLRSFAPDAVVHTAGALRDSPWPQLVGSNLEPVVSLLRAAAACGSPRVVLTSSGSVYGSVEHPLPLREDGPARPANLYGVSKRAGEDVAAVLAAELRLSVVSARVFNLVGPGLSERHLPAVLANHITAARRSGGPPEVRVGPLGATRDFVDVRDAARALVTLSVCHGTPEVVNVASGVETRVRDLAATMARLGGDPVEVREARDPRPGDVSRAYADVGRLRETGFRPRHGLEESARGMLHYYRDLVAAAPPG